MADIAITCHGVWKSYRIYHQRSNTLKEKVLSRRNRFQEFWALRGVDLEVPAGSTIGVIGPNGSGKSTLLKTMARILTPNRGVVRVNGTVSPMLELGTGFHPELTGRENVYLGGSLLGHSRRQIDALFDEIDEFAGISEFMDMPLKTYSTGMYARLAFALATTIDPEILLLDEVLSVGDASFQRRCLKRIAEFRSEGRTIVFVSHSLEAVRMLCSEVLWIDHGVVRQFGDVHEVIAGYLSDVDAEAGRSGLPTPVRTLRAGEAHITGVALLDAGGAAVNTFRTGDRVTIRLQYRSHELPDDLLCSVAVHRGESLAYVFGQNSHEAGLVLERSGEGVVEVVIPELPLLRGTYLVSVALQDEALEKTYDYHDRQYSFEVVDNPVMPVEAGIVHVETEWATRPEPAGPGEEAEQAALVRGGTDLALEG